jgi:hypothetical protein
MNSMRATRISMGLITLALVAIFTGHRFLDHQAYAGPGYYACYPTGPCIACTDTGNTYKCASTFNDEVPGNCGGGTYNCEIVNVCDLKIDCLTGANLGSCPDYTYGCVPQ